MALQGELLLLPLLPPVLHLCQPLGQRACQPAAPSRCQQKQGRRLMPAALRRCRAALLLCPLTAGRCWGACKHRLIREGKALRQLGAEHAYAWYAAAL